jgi:hypothetical protein
LKDVDHEFEIAPYGGRPHDPLILAVTNNDELENALTLSKCRDTVIAFLKGLTISFPDIWKLQKFYNLRKIDLSFCKITKLPEKMFFETFLNLEFLFLHNNLISEWSDLEQVSGCKYLLHLTMYSNPVSSIGYRHFLVNSIPSLLALDMHIITDEERSDDVSFGDRFRALSDYMRLSIPEFSLQTDQRNYLIWLNQDVYALKRIYEKNSPSIMIQRCFRGYIVRKNVANSLGVKKESVIIIQKVVRGMLLRRRLRRELALLMKEIEEPELIKSIFLIRQEKAIATISKIYIKYKHNKKWLDGRIKASICIQKLYRGMKERKRSYIKALELEQYKRLYICREQKPFLLNLIKEMSENYPQHGTYLDIAKNNFYITQDYWAIRIMEPEGAHLPDIRINHFSYATFRSKVTFNLWNKKLKEYKVFGNMMIFDERETKRRIDVMKTSGLKFTKAKVLYDMDLVHQNSRCWWIKFRGSEWEYLWRQIRRFNVIPHWWLGIPLYSHRKGVPAQHWHWRRRKPTYFDVLW